MDARMYVRVPSRVRHLIYRLAGPTALIGVAVVVRSVVLLFVGRPATFVCFIA